MKRRGRFTGLSWLGGFPDLQVTLSEAMVGGTRSDPLHALIAQLTASGYLIELELRGSHFLMHLFPIKAALPLGQPALAIAYSGQNIRSIFLAAIGEIELLARREVPYQSANTETVRWVSS